MASLKDGTTIGGNIAWHSGNITPPDIASAANITGAWTYSTGVYLASGVPLVSSFASFFFSTSATDWAIQCASGQTSAGLSLKDSAGTNYGRILADSTGLTLYNGASAQMIFGASDISTISLDVTGTITTSGNIIANGLIDANGRIQISGGAWHDDMIELNNGNYSIGANINTTFGGSANSPCIKFSVNNANTNGFWFGHNGHTASQGGVYISKNGNVNIARGLRVGYGVDDQTVAAGNEIDAKCTVKVGDGSTNTNLQINKSQNFSDHIEFFNAGTKVGEIGCQDDTWLRINQTIAKNIYTPRMFRADGGLQIGSTTSSGLYIPGDESYLHWKGQEFWRAPVAGTYPSPYDFTTFDQVTGPFWYDGSQTGRPSNWGCGIAINYAANAQIRLAFNAGGSKMYLNRIKDDLTTTTWLEVPFLNESADSRWHSHHQMYDTSYRYQWHIDASNTAVSWYSNTTFRTASSASQVGLTGYLSNAYMISSDGFHGVSTKNGTYTDALLHFNYIGTTQWSVYARFYNNGTYAGGISHVSGGTVAYNTSSDYRLKEAVVPINDGINRLDTLNPVYFTWSKTGDPGEGFIAHELQNTIPGAVTGKKDGVDPDGNPEYQGVDYGKVTPVLTAALQEAIAKIRKLEADVEYLNSIIL